MAEAEETITKRYAVVTGGNRGIGFEICRQLASQPNILVVLTARSEISGNKAVEKLIQSGVLSTNLVCHQLDVANPASVASLFDFVKTQFGKLDILVNNAGVNGLIINEETVRASTKEDGELDLTKLLQNTNYDLSKQCIDINYYGTTSMGNTFIPLLQLSASPRIVNVSSQWGRLENMSNEWAKEVLSDVQNLTEERINEVVDQYLKDYRGSGLSRWPASNMVAKAAVNAYTRFLAKKYPSFKVNSVCPGFVKTDLNSFAGLISAAEGAQSPVRLALLSNDGPSGLFFIRDQETTP